MKIPHYQQMSSKVASVAGRHNPCLRAASSSGPSNLNLSSLRATLVRALLDANGKIKAYEKALEQNHSSDWFDRKDLDELRKKQEELAKQYATKVKDKQQEADKQHHQQEIQRQGKLRVNRRRRKQETLQWCAERTAQAEREYRTMVWQRRLKEVQLRRQAQAVRAHREEAARIRTQHEAEAEHIRQVAQRRLRHEQYLLSKAKYEAHVRELNRIRAQKEAEEKQNQWKLRQIVLQELSTRLTERHHQPIIAQEAKQHLKDLSLKIRQEFQNKILAEYEDQYKEIRLRNQRKVGKPSPATSLTEIRPRNPRKVGKPSSAPSLTDTRASIQNWRSQNLNQESLIQTCK